ncbi:MAG: tyrosine-type recombinase/integrase [Dehalococcoidia bacterium]
MVTPAITTKRTGRKRGNNEGSIKLRGDGRYEARVTLLDGRRKSYYGKTRTDVQRQLTVALRNVQQGTPVHIGRQTVSQFLTVWLEDAVKVKNRPKTYDSYRGIVQVHLIPGLGRKQLTSLSAQDVQTFLNERAMTVSPSMAQHCRSVLRIALNRAIKWKLINHNAAAATDPPRIEARREVTALSLDNARAILAAFDGDRLGPLVTLALTLGLRRGELLGLRWSDLDLDYATLAVRFQAQKHAGTWRFVEPKSKESRRTLPLPAFLVDTLRQHRTRLLEERLQAGPLWQDYDLVFPSVVGTPQDGNNVLHRFQTRLKAAGLPPMRFHDLRHGAATVLLAQGASQREIMAILGHSQIGTTMNIYAHIAPELLRQSAERMQVAFGGGLSGLGSRLGSTRPEMTESVHD